jgi:hypothetical protein
MQKNCDTFYHSLCMNLLLLLLLLLFTLTANGFLPGGSGTTIRHNTQITLTYLLTELSPS